MKSCLFATTSRLALGPTQPHIQWVTGALSLGVNQSGREADHSRTASAEIENAWSYIISPTYVFMVWWLVKQWDNFPFTLKKQNHFEKLMVLQLVNKFSAFYRTWNFINMLGQMNPIDILKPYFFKVLFNMIPYLHLGLSSALFPRSIPTKVLRVFISSYMLHVPPMSSSLILRT